MATTKDARKIADRITEILTEEMDNIEKAAFERGQDAALKSVTQAAKQVKAQGSGDTANAQPTVPART